MTKSLLLVTIWTALCFALAAHAEDVRPPIELNEKCAVLYGDDSGGVSHQVLESLHVAEPNPVNSEFVLPPDAPANVQVIQCGRESLVPREEDCKVLGAGYPFILVAPDGRTGVLEQLHSGLQFRMIAGEMKDSESSLVKSFLDKCQGLLLARQAADSDSAAP